MSFLLICYTLVRVGVAADPPGNTGYNIGIKLTNAKDTNNFHVQV